METPTGPQDRIAMNDAGSRVPWWWALLIALILPAYHLLIYFLRTGQIGAASFGSLVFAPAGLIEGLVFIYWLRQVRSDRQRRNTLIGFVAGFMFAFFGSIFGALMLPPTWLGGNLGGALPWLLCTWLGFRREVAPVNEARQ